MPRGGARPGAGRKKGSRNRESRFSGESSSGKRYESAEAYLHAVVIGDEPPDRNRIAAAKAMLPYQVAKRRAPLASEAPKQMALSEELDQERQQAAEWEKTQQGIRAKLRLVE